jgi:hypothetical protein
MPINTLILKRDNVTMNYFKKSIYDLIFLVKINSIITLEVWFYILPFMCKY